MTCRLSFIIVLIFSILLVGCKQQEPRLFVGSFTKPGDKGLSIYNFDSSNGKLTPLSKADVGPNPSYFCYSEDNKMLYVANEVMEFMGEFGGGLSSFKFNEETGNFDKMHEMRTPYGGPCYISMSPDSSYLFLANYPNGSVVVVRLDSSGIPETITDTILYNKPEPDASHAHMIMNDPSGEKIYVTDLGMDRIIRYNFNASEGELISIDTLNVNEGYGPRHFVFSKDGSELYVINELGSKISVFSVSGRPELIQTISTVREDFMLDNYCADIHLSLDGKYLYGSNRGENTIVTFAVKDDGTLLLAGHSTCGGNWPRNFSIDPSGKFLLVGNQKSDSIAVFRLNQTTGIPIEPPDRYHIPAPACLKFY